MERAKMDNNIKNILKFIMLNDNFFKIGSLFIYFLIFIQVKNILKKLFQCIKKHKNIHISFTSGASL